MKNFTVNIVLCYKYFRNTLCYNVKNNIALIVASLCNVVEK
jgi:hypothetical protein